MVEVHDRPSLIAASLAYDAEQAAREKEFQAQYQRHLGKKLHQRTPVDWAWVRRQLEPWKDSTSLPGRTMPALYFGENWRVTPGYIPIERRLDIIKQNAETK